MRSSPRVPDLYRPSGPERAAGIPKVKRGAGTTAPPVQRVSTPQRRDQSTTAGAVDWRTSESAG
jgi:hypothetical protein